MSESMTDKPYTILGPPTHENRWNEALQRIESGWRVTAQWNANGAVIPVFVPDSADLVSTADALIRAQGEQLEILTKA